MTYCAAVSSGSGGDSDGAAGAASAFVGGGLPSSAMTSEKALVAYETLIYYQMFRIGWVPGNISVCNNGPARQELMGQRILAVYFYMAPEYPRENQ